MVDATNDTIDKVIVLCHLFHLSCLSQVLQVTEEIGKCLGTGSCISHKLIPSHDQWILDLKLSSDQGDACYVIPVDRVL